MSSKLEDNNVGRHVPGNLFPTSKMSYSKQLMNIQSKVDEKVFQDLVEPIPILFCNNEGIVYPKSLTVVQGKTGVHKSRYLELLISSVLSKSTIENGAYVKYNNEYSKNVTVVLVDTERSYDYNLPKAIQSIKMMSGYSINAKMTNFQYTSLINVERQDRFQALREYVVELRKSTRDHLLVVLDIVTDCLGNFNDISESMQLIDLMNKFMIELDASFICVIHENPSEGSNKARGHIGTEIQNKATTQIQLTFKDDDRQLLELNFLKNRNTGKVNSIYLEYDESNNSLMPASQELIESGMVSDSYEKVPLKEVIQYVGELLVQRMKGSELITELVKLLKASDRTVREKLKIIENGKLELEVGSDKFNLTKSKDGRIVYYELTLLK